MAGIRSRLGIAARYCLACALLLVAMHMGARADVAEAKSVMCDLGSLDNWNTNRLVGCDSAVIFEEGGGVDVARFTINPNDPQISAGVRAEIRDPHEAVNGDETWYRFSTRIPSDFPFAQEHSVVLCQWHERQHPGQPSQRPPLAHRLVNGDLIVTLWNEEVFERERGVGPGEIIYRERAIETDTWHEFVYQVIWLQGNRGRVRGWKRACTELPCQTTWNQTIEHAGAVGYDDVKSYYFKIGIYTVHEFTQAMSVDHSLYHRGASAGSVGLTDSELQ